MKQKWSALVLSLLLSLAADAGALVVYSESTEAQFTVAGSSHNSTYITGTGLDVHLGLDYYGHAEGFAVPGSDEWFNPDWKFRLPLTINSANPVTLTNYPVAITLNTQAIVAFNAMNADGSDIRFTTAAAAGSAATLPYYIESGMNSPATKIWVKLPVVAAGDSTIYLYSGSTAAAAASNLADTFVMGDNFNLANGAAPSTATWSAIESASPQTGSLRDIQSGQLRMLFGSPLNTQYYGLRSNSTYSFAAGRRYHANLYANTSGESWTSFTLCKTNYNYSYDEQNWLRFSMKNSAAGATYVLEKKLYGTNTTLASGAIGLGLHGVDIVIGTATFSVMLDGSPTPIYTAANNTVSITNPYIYLEATSGSASLQEFIFDNVSVQPYSNPEPAYTSPDTAQGRRYPSGSFVSQPIDSTVPGTKWQGTNWEAIMPSSSAITVETRANETDVTLSTFTAVAKGGNPAVSGRYLQYRLNYSTLDPRYTATVSSVTLTYGSPPNPPSGANANTVDESHINWRWTDNSSGQYEEEGFRVLHGTTSVMKGEVTAGTTFFIEGSLSPNTQYSRLIVGYNFAGVGLPSAVSRYTAAVTPYVSGDKSTGTWLSGNITFLNMAGFGNNGVAYYRYFWTQSDTVASWASGYSLWTSGTLVKTAASSGNWYLHVRSYNGEDLPVADHRTYGPYWYDIQSPSVTGFSPSSSPWTSSFVNPTVSLSDPAGFSKLYRVRHNWTNSTSRPATGDGGWQPWSYTIQGNDTATYNTSKASAGVWYLHIEVQDLAGNGGLIGVEGYSYSGPYKIDTTVPTGGIVINENAVYTATRAVTLSLTFTDGESGVKEVSYNNDFNNPGTYSLPELAQPTSSWTLSEGDGPKKVYYRVTNNAGASAIFNDTINLISTTSITGEAKFATASGVMGEPANTFEASAVLTWKPTGEALNLKTISFYFQGSTRTAITDTLGRATTDFFVPAATGTYVYVVAFSTDGVYAASSSTGIVTAGQRATNMITEDVNGLSNTDFIAKATLLDRDSDPAAKIIGATVTFSFEGNIATAATNGIGVATVTYRAPVPVAFYDYTASYAGGPVYGAKTATGRVGVGLKVTSLVASPAVAPVDTDFNVQATLLDGAIPVVGSTISFTFLGSTYTAVTNGSGVAVSSFTSPSSSGTYSYTANFYGDETFAASSGGSTLTVSRRQPSLAGDLLTGYVNASFQARAVLSDGATKLAGKPVVFVFETSSFTALTNSEGVSTAVFNSGSLPRASTCYYYFEGDAGYLFADSTGTVSIERRPVALAASDTNTPLSSTVTVTAELKDMAGTPTVIPGETITFSFRNEVKTAVTNSLGVATVTYQSGTSTGTYEFYISFPQGDVYLAANDTGTVTMAKRLVAVSAFPEYKTTFDLIKPVVSLKDAGTGEYISSQTIIFNYYGVPQSTTTGSSGGTLGKAYATYPSTPVAGVYSYYADFLGTELYAANSSTSSITISSRTVNLSAFPQSAVLGTTFTVTAEFRDGTNNALKSGKAIRIAYSTAAAVNAVTSVDGVVTSTFSTPLSTGTYKWFANFAGDAAYVAASSTGTITITRRSPTLTPLAASKFVWDNIYYTATFLDDGAPIPGADVDFYFQGATRTATTDETGTTGVFTTAFSSVSVPGIYGYSVAFGGNTNYSAQTASSTLTVSARPSTLSLGPISTIANSTVALTATLLDTNSPATRILSGRDVYFTLQDSTYGVKAVTNASGVARVVYTASSTIKDYTYSATYYGNTNYTGTSSSNTLTVSLRPSVLEMSDYYPAASSTFSVYAVLKDFNTGVKIATRTVSFSFLSVVKSSMTNVLGYASTYYVALPGTESYPITASFAGDTLYTPASISKTVFPGKRNTILQTSDMLGAVAKDTFTVTARLRDFDSGAYLPGQSVRFTYSASTAVFTLIGITDSTGTASVIFEAKASTGTYSYTATFLATSLYNGYSNTSAVLVNRRNAILEPADLTGIPASSSFTASALLRDGGINLSAKQLTFVFTPATPTTKNATTNGIGVASVTYMSPPSTGAFSYSASFADGDPLYKPVSASGSVGVVLKNTVLTALDVPDAVVGASFISQAQLLAIEPGGNVPVASTKTITFSFTTGTVNAVTNVGVATASFIAPPAVGTYEYTATFAGDGMYGASSSSGTVTVKRRPVIFSISVPAGEPYTLSSMTVKANLVDGKTGQPLPANPALPWVKIYFSVSNTTHTIQMDEFGVSSTTFYVGDASGTYRYAGTFEGNTSYSESEVNEQTDTTIKINPRPTSVLANLGNGETVWNWTFNNYTPTVYVFDPLAGNIGVAGLTVSFISHGETRTGTTLGAPLGQVSASSSFTYYPDAGTYPVEARFLGNKTYDASVLPGGTNWSIPQEGKFRNVTSPANIAMDSIQEAFPDEDKVISGVAHDGYLGDRGNARPVLKGLQVRYRISDTACNPYPTNCPWGTLGTPVYANVNDSYIATATVHAPAVIGDYPIERWFATTNSFYYWEVTEDKRVLRVGRRPTDLDVATADPLVVGAQMPITIKVKLKSTSQGDIGIVGKPVVITFNGGTPQTVTTVSGGIAQYTFSGMPTGDYTYTATFAEDTTYNAAVLSPLGNVQVVKNTTQLTGTPVASIPAGNNFIAKATLLVIKPDMTTEPAQGRTIHFTYPGNTNLDAVTNVSGVAQVTFTSQLVPGSYNFTAVLDENANDLGSSAAAPNWNIGVVQRRTSLTSVAVNPVYILDNFTSTATLADLDASLNLPTPLDVSGHLTGLTVNFNLHRGGSQGDTGNQAATTVASPLGQATKVFLSPAEFGAKSYTASFPATTLYAAATSDAGVNVLKRTTSLTAGAEPYPPTNTIFTATVTLRDNTPSPADRTPTLMGVGIHVPVKFVYDGHTTYALTNDLGVAVATFTAQNISGDYTCDITYEGNSTYASKNVSMTVHVVKRLTNITGVVVMNWPAGASFVAQATLTDNISGAGINLAHIDFVFTGGGTFNAADDTNVSGIADATFTAPLAIGDYNYTVCYPGDDTYAGKCDNDNLVNVSKAETTMATPNATVIVNNTFSPMATLRGKESGVGVPGKPISFTYNGVLKGTPSTGIGGTAVQAFVPTSTGTFELNVNFAGDTAFFSSWSSATITVNRRDSGAATLNSETTVAKTFIASVTLSDLTSPPDKIAGRRVDFSFPSANGATTSSATTNSVGLATTSFKSPNIAGSYPFSVIFNGDPIYNPSNNATANVVVSKRSTQLTVGVAGTNTIGTTLDVFTATATLKWDNGTVAVPGKAVWFTYRGVKTQGSDTDANGKSYLNFNAGLNSGTWELRADFEDAADPAFDVSFGTNSVLVGKRNCLVTPDMATISVYDTFNATVTFKDGVNVSSTPAGKYPKVALSWVALSTGNATLTNGSGKGYFQNKTAPDTAGAYSIESWYPGDTTYFPSLSSAAVITVIKRASQLSLPNVDTMIGRQFTATALLRNGNITLDNKDVLFTFEGKTFNVKTVDGVASATFTVTLSTGGTQIRADFAGDNSYLASVPTPATATVTAAMRPTSITQYDFTAIKDLVFKATGTLRDVDGLNVTGRPVWFKFNNLTISTPTTNSIGVATAAYVASVITGVYPVEVHFDGDWKYVTSSTTLNMTVQKRPTSIVPLSSNITIRALDLFNSTATLRDMDNSALTIPKPLRFVFFDEPFTRVTEVTGVAITTWSAPAVAATYNGNVYFDGDANYEPSSAPITVTVQKRLTGIGINSLSAKAGDNFKSTATLTDLANGTLKVSARPVTFSFSWGGSTGAYTNGVGIATAAYDATVIADNNYTLTGAFAGDSTYASTTTTIPFPVLKRDAFVTGLYISTRVLDAFTASGSFFDTATGQPVPDRLMTFVLQHGSTLTATTNGSGMASVNFTAHASSGTYKLYISNGLGDDTFNPVTVYVSSVTMNRRNSFLTLVSTPTASIIGSSFSATTTMYDSVSGLVVPSKGISFLFQTNTVPATTNPGTGSTSTVYTAGLITGAYPLQASFTGDSTYNSTFTTRNIQLVKYPTKVSGPAITVIMNEVLTATATLTNYNDAPVQVQPLTFSFQGSPQTPDTDASGIAYAAYSTVGVASGTYQVSVNYGGDAQYESTNTFIPVLVRKRMPVITADPVLVRALNIFTATATLTDQRVTTQKLDGQTVLFEFLVGVDTFTNSGVTDLNGVATSTFTAPAASGPYQVKATFTGNASYYPLLDYGDVTVEARPSRLMQNNSLGVIDEVFRTTATLVDIETSEPILTKTIVFDFNAYPSSTAVTLAGGRASVGFTAPSSSGAYVLNSAFPAGDITYTLASSTGVLTVIRRPAKLTAPDISGIIDEEFTASVSITDRLNSSAISGSTIVFNFQASPFTAFSSAGGLAVSTYTAPAPSGLYYAAISFGGDARYLPNSTTTQLTVNKRPSEILPDVVLARVDDVFFATATLRDTLKPSDPPIDRELVFFFEGSSFTVRTGPLGVAVSTFMAPSSSGTVRLNISFAGDARYEASTAFTDVDVLQRLSLMTLNPITIAAKDVLTSNAILTDKAVPGVKAANREITFTFQGEDFVDLTDNDGIAVSTFAGPVSSGTYTLVADFAGDSVYAASSATISVIVIQRASGITVTDSSAYPLEPFTASGALKDRDTQDAIVGRTMGFLLDGVPATGVTDDVGLATAAYTPPGAFGTYELNATFAGDATYAAVTYSSGTVLVMQRPTQLDALDNNTIALEVFTASVTFSDVRFSTVIANKDVVFNFEGAYSTATTDAYGVATASFSAPISSGTYYFQARFAGTSVYAVTYTTGAISVGTRFTRVVAKDTNANVGEPYILKAQLIDPAKEGLDGFYVPNVTISFKVKDKNGVPVDEGSAITNELGYATATFNGPGAPDVYFYTATFNGNYTYSASSNTAMVKVGLLTSLVAFDVETVALEKFTGKAKLTDYLSTTLDDKPIRFTFLDQLNSGMTTADGNSGIASSTFTAPSSSGTYYYNAYFDGDSIYSASNATATVHVTLRPSAIVATPATAYAYSSFTATILLTNTLGDPALPIGGTNVDLYFAGSTITVNTDADGVGSATFFASASSGTFNFYATFAGNETYSPSVKTGVLTVTRRPINMLTYNITDVTANSTFTARVQMKDNLGDPIKDLGVAFDFVNDQTDIDTTDEFGIAEVVFTAPSSSGVYVYNAVFYENQVYVGASGSGNVTVGPRPTLLFTSATGVKLGAPQNLSARLVDVSNQTGVAGQTLTFYFGGSTLTAVTDDLGVSTVTFDVALTTGTYYYESVFNGNGVTYSGSSSSAPVTIAVNLTSLVAKTGISLKILEPLLVDANIYGPDGVLSGMPIVFSFEGSSTTSVSNGFGKATATFETTSLASTGTYNYEAEYPGDTMYVATSDTANVVTIYRRDSLLIARDSQAVPSKAFIAEAKFYDNVNGSAYMGATLSGKTIVFELHHTTFTQTRTTVTSALGVSTMSFLAPSSTGTYLLTARFADGDPIYESALSSATLTVLLDDGTGAIKTKLRLENVTTYITKAFVASGTLTASELPVPGKNVLFEYFNGVSTAQAIGYTDEVGLATAPFTAPLSSGVYIITASFDTGDPNYASTTGTGTITTLRYPDSLTAQAVVAYTGELFIAKAVLRDELTQTVMPGKTVTFEYFNGVSTITKTSVTSSTGCAEATFTAPAAAGDYTYKALFAGTSEYVEVQGSAAILIASKGSSADLVGYAVGAGYSTSDGYEITIGTAEVFTASATLSSRGIPIQGKPVTISFQGVFRVSTTNAQGLAFSTFTAPVSSGTFFYQANFAGDDSYNTASTMTPVGVSFRKQPEPPTTFTVEVTSDSVKLAWGAIIQDQLDGYIIEESASLRGVITSSVAVSSTTLDYTCPVDETKPSYFKIKTKLDDDQKGGTSLILEIPSKLEDPDRVPNYYYMSPDEGANEWAAWVKIPGKVMDKVTASAADFKIDVRKDANATFCAADAKCAAYTIVATGDQKKLDADLRTTNKNGVKLTIAYPKSGTGTSAASGQLAMFWYNGVEWIKLGGEIDVLTGEIYTYSRVMGQFAIRAAPLASSFTLTKVAPRIFSPDEASTNVNRARFYFENPTNGEVTIRIFDITGALVRRNLDVEGANIMYWNGKNQSGTLVKGGVYIYQMEAGEEVITGTVVVAK